MTADDDEDDREVVFFSFIEIIAHPLPTVPDGELVVVVIVTEDEVVLYVNDTTWFDEEVCSEFRQTKRI